MVAFRLGMHYCTGSHEYGSRSCPLHTWKSSACALGSMATLGSLSCALCSRILYKSCDRRKLYNGSTKEAHDALKEVTAGVFSNAVNILLALDAYLCMTYVELLIKLKKDLRCMEEELIQRIKRAEEKRGLSKADEQHAAG